MRLGGFKVDFGSVLAWGPFVLGELVEPWLSGGRAWCVVIQCPEL